jgi:hypothetical protein
MLTHAARELTNIERDRSQMDLKYYYNENKRLW